MQQGVVNPAVAAQKPLNQVCNNDDGDHVGEADDRLNDLGDFPVADFRHHNGNGQGSGQPSEDKDEIVAQGIAHDNVEILGFKQEFKVLQQCIIHLLYQVLFGDSSENLSLIFNFVVCFFEKSTHLKYRVEKPAVWRRTK